MRLLVHSAHPQLPVSEYQSLESRDLYFYHRLNRPPNDNIGLAHEAYTHHTHTHTSFMLHKGHSIKYDRPFYLSFFINI